MKIPGKFILKVAGTLTVISLVVAALLGFVNSITADKIAEIDAENTRIAMSAVAPEGSEFGDKIEVTDDMVAAAATQSGKILELYPVTNGGAEAGYVMKISASGSQGTIVMMVGVDANKAITGISVVSHAETSGIGTKVVGNEPNAAGEPISLWVSAVPAPWSLAATSPPSPVPQSPPRASPWAPTRPWLLPMSWAKKGGAEL